MAEKFLEEIYADALVLDDLRECLSFMARTDYYNARLFFNKGMARLEIMLAKYAIENPDSANEIQDFALDIIDKWGEWSYISGMIRGKLIPMIYEYMKRFCTIDVEEGNFLLKSSDSGFLTMKDIEENMFIHDIHDPMLEAGDVADMLYHPLIEDYVLYGCGLGYLPYKLWTKTGGAAHIVIYEDDKRILEYAKHYGVLDWIDEKNIEVRNAPDYLDVIQSFSKEVDFRNKKKTCYVTPYKKNKYKNAYGGQFLALVYRMEYFWVSYGVSATNIWKNRKLKSLTFSQLKEKLFAEKWVVAAAGPSLNYSMDFIKDRKNDSNLVAVNTVLRRFSNEGVLPDLSVAADPFGQIPEHLDDIEEFTRDIPMIADWLVCWNYSYIYQGDKCFIPTPAGENIEGYNHENEEVWNVSGTVSALAIEAAIRLGGKKIYLVGLDLAFPGGEVHAKDMPHDKISYKDEAIKVASMDGGMVETTAVFNDFRFGIEDIIGRHPEIEFINMSRDGAVIKGARRGFADGI